ncbi:metallophosphoesterase family protein [Candidatus Nitrosocosmicus sp. SS]|uniref:metallophosphoesterase family protein n=1 Tax=Candidatus Nitrosocosmicus agrestis TaxID=2563600 RepID=UPI00122E05E0|nr:metallophosphoesterase [Candidatus Nitrosocosmicus sp. SS]KAF0870094.1 metallophosphoesterase [Candidatus Nitrosocosmicus sp. SS]
MRIIQISDLHIGGLFKQDSFDTLVDEVNNDLKPDVLIISGDLTDEGVYFQYEKAKKELSRFLSKNMIVFPGNHDYRHTGYLLFPQFFPDIGKSIDSKVHTYRHPENLNLKILITTVGTAVADRDEGEVGESQNLWLNRVLKEDNKVDDRSIPEGSSSKKNTVKIVAMHHHLIAIPDTGYTNIVGISDAGDVLRTCLANNVDLIICGHKHRPWLWDFGQMKIAYAGTACSWRYRGVFEDTYNIIDIEKDGVLKVDIKIVGGDRMPLSDVVSRYDPEVRVTRIADMMSPD